MRKAGANNYKFYSLELLKFTSKPISFEVFADSENEMISQGKEISNWGKNVYVKVPVVNSKGKFMGKVISSLSKDKIKLNITAVYNFNQVKKILKHINNKSNIIISLFVGRMADAGKDPIPVLKQSIRLSKKFKNVEILWASTREAYNYRQAREIKCDIITMPPAIIEKIEKFGKSYDDLTVETVKGFLDDSRRSNFKIY